MSAPFLGSEALASGVVRKHELRSHYRAVFPGVYLPLPAALNPTFRERVESAYLWTRRGAVVAGLTAARLHGSKWIDDALAIELVWRNQRPPAGVTVHAVRLRSDEMMRLASGIPITTPVRTAFDIGCRGSLVAAVARLDALGAATRFSVFDVDNLATRHRGARGVKQLRRALALFDPGAQSPKESWLRLLVQQAGFPTPKTQVKVGRYYLDMGWEDLKLAIEYDGDHHRTNREQYAWDITRHEELADAGWMIVRVAAGSKPAEVLQRLGKAWVRKGPLPNLR